MGEVKAGTPQDFMRVSAFSLPKAPSLSEIRSAGAYILVKHLVRTPLELSRDGELAADLCSAWRADSQFLKFECDVDPAAKFSDGTRITGIDLKESLELQMAKGPATHFDFTLIKKVELVDEHKVRIILKNPNSRFLQQLVHPEFGVLAKSDRLSNAEPKFAVTSGPYFLKSYAAGKAELRANRYFNRGQNEGIDWIGASVDDQAKLLHEGKLDFIMPFGELDKKSMTLLSDNPSIRSTAPHIGFTHWLTLNPRMPELKSVDARKKIFQALKPRLDRLVLDQKQLVWRKADRLYIPVFKDSESATQTPKVLVEKVDIPLQVLLDSRFKFYDVLRDAIKEIAPNAIIDTYSSQNEFALKKAQEKFHLFQTNNDFSSLDVSEAVLVSINPSNPLIVMPASGDAEKFRDRLLASNSDEQRKLCAEFEKIVFDQVLILPIAHQRVLFFHNHSLDLSAWSNLFPEISFWKIPYPTKK